MIFADLYFLFLFLPLCLICYYRAKKLRTRNYILIVFSLLFYAWGEPVYVLLLLFSAFFNWQSGIWIENAKAASAKEGGGKNAPDRAKPFVALAIVVDLAFLLVFKYSGFFVENVNALFRAQIPVPSLRMPIGISFFTFQAISYILDVYWGTVSAQKRFYRFLVYLSFFAQLIAGPIVRYSVIEKELTRRRVTASDFFEGGTRLVLGLAKKVILANNLHAIVDQFFGNGPAGLSTLGTWYTVILYSMYVYFDFSGYSDMAIGMGRMFGFHFDENFRYPFVSENISEFWQRWHISLGSFFRDYLLYVPLFGKRRKYANLFLVWFCTGFWHGASWNYILWGLYFGGFIFLELKLGKKKMRKWPVVVRHLYTLAILAVGFGIFYFENFRHLGQFLLNIFGINLLQGLGGFADRATWTSLVNNLFLIAASVIFCMPVVPKVREWIVSREKPGHTELRRYLTLAVCVVLLVVSAIMLVDTTNNPFLYWRF